MMEPEAWHFNLCSFARNCFRKYDPKNRYVYYYAHIGNESVYCPWSVINYLTNRFEDPEIKPKNYWANSSSNDIIRKLLNQATPTMREEIEKLIEGKTLTKKIYPEMTYAEINQSVEHIWSVMFNTGYLTSVQCVDSVSSRFIEFRIPNEEVRTIFEEQIIDWFNDRIRIEDRSPEVSKIR